MSCFCDFHFSAFTISDLLSMSDVIISVENLGKRYRIRHQAERQRYATLRDVIAEKARGVFQMLKLRRQKTEINKRTEGAREWKFQLSNFTLPSSRGLLGFEGCFLRGQAGRGGGHHRAERGGQKHAAENLEPHHRTDRRPGAHREAGWRACWRWAPAFIRN